MRNATTIFWFRAWKTRIPEAIVSKTIESENSWHIANCHLRQKVSQKRDGVGLVERLGNFRKVMPTPTAQVAFGPQWSSLKSRILAVRHFKGKRITKSPASRKFAEDEAYAQKPLKNPPHHPWGPMLCWWMRKIKRHLCGKCNSWSVLVMAESDAMAMIRWNPNNMEIMTKELIIVRLTAKCKIMMAVRQDSRLNSFLILERRGLFVPTCSKTTVMRVQSLTDESGQVVVNPGYCKFVQADQSCYLLPLLWLDNVEELTQPWVELITSHGTCPSQQETTLSSLYYCETADMHNYW